jgi:hypothetical protein
MDAFNVLMELFLWAESLEVAYTILPGYVDTAYKHVHNGSYPCLDTEKQKLVEVIEQCWSTPKGQELIQREGQRGKHFTDTDKGRWRNIIRSVTYDELKHFVCNGNCL